ncbi:MAG: helix-hairpin-helix domain-containing protein [Candidatus Omnitrophica bacterium]|nr:helix-hairpin-helix domain-containing protein [Candidatus Omnitrophota bacterium]MDD5553754.1 helix-hairpin-helix domain-containing protein [Candidatus Omnitrophota bacterium]
MFDLTLQERKVVLFLMGTALLGLGLNFSMKVNQRMKRFVLEYDRLVKVDLNKAGLTELSCLSGISPGLAKKILAYRDANGHFRKIEDLKEVKGIGDYRYEKLKDLLFVE